MWNNDLKKEIEEIWEKYKDVIPKYPNENGIILSPKFQYKVDYIKYK